MIGRWLLPPASRDGDAGARNVRLLSVLRWLAIGGQLATILLVATLLHVPLPLAPMLSALAALALLNLAIARAASRHAIGDRTLFATLMADVACLTVQLFMSGGIANPFVTLYLLQVVIAAVLLPIWASWALVILTSIAIAALVASPHHLPAAVGAALSPASTLAAWFSFTLAATLLVAFVTVIVRNLAEREARLAALRERAAEEEHVVRMGLLASGAAHELGTPLASLAVMLGDWRRDPAVVAAPDLMADVDAMAGEVARCKDILGQVLLAAGEVRGDAPVRTTLRGFVGGTLDAWRRSGALPVTFVDRLSCDPAIVADRPLAQTITALLDNAVDADARAITVTATLLGELVELTVTDDGRGFPPDILAAIGKPYVSTKRQHGAGLGLFLASNVLRTLGGSAHAVNVPGGGAQVRLVWPLAALTVVA